jgi:CBS domain-containing protein
MKQELVKDWMTRNVVTISPDTTLPEAHRLMIEKRVRRLPVMRNDLLVGIVTRGDVRGAEPSGATSLSIWELNYLLSQLKIEEIMTRNLITISANATIGQAAEMMLEHKVSGLPVVDMERKLVGIITESDIFRMVVRAWRQVDVVEPELQTVGCLQ